MRKKAVTVTFYTSILLGILATLDLIFFTDKETGFVTVGGIFLRYALVFVGFLVCILPLMYKNNSVKCPAFSPLIAFSSILVGITCDIYGFFSILAFFTKNAGVLGLIKGVLITVFGIVALNASLCKINKMQATARKYAVYAVLGATGFYLLTIERFITRTSSIFRFAPVMGILSALAGVVFSTAFIKVLCLNSNEQSYKHLMAKGQVAFLMCTCIEMPHTVYLCIAGYAPLTDILVAIMLGSIGFAGIMLSFACVWAKPTTQSDN